MDIFGHVSYNNTEDLHSQNNTTNLAADKTYSYEWIFTTNHKVSSPS